MNKNFDQPDSKMTIQLKDQYIPGYQDVLDAAARIKHTAIVTPLLRSDILDALSGAKVFLKTENLQRTGSFKFRGAYNAISALNAEAKDKGVLAVSSGNHAQGIAEAARILDVSATIIMPEDSPSIKLERTKRSGATVITYDRMVADRDALAAEYLDQHQNTFIHPFNNPYVIAGQGTVGLEIAEALESIDQTPDHVFVCAGGGGLTAGIALTMNRHFPTAKVHTCEPEGFDDYRRSLAAGQRLKNDRPGGSICEAIVTPMPGEIGFAINRNLVSDGKVVSDNEALDAVAFAFNELKLVVEPGGAVALAALIKEGKVLAGKTVVITLSGGNIDPDTLAMALTRNG